MEMHGIPMKDVLQLINDLGGKSIATYDGRFLTPGWNGYIYWVGK
jgi:hypothetical protein